MKVLFACGGTAGHINPALAVAQRIHSIAPSAGVLFVGSGRDLENSLIPAAGYELVNLPITGLSRARTLDGLKYNAKTAWNLMRASRQARKILKEFKPDVVLGTGGYVCYPVLTAAHALGIPSAIHESNAVPGLTTRMLEGVADRIMLAFPDKENIYRHREKLLITGTPVREDFSAMSRDEAKMRLGCVGKPLVVSFWGSLGAARMNEYMEEFVRLCAGGEVFHLIHATGGGEEYYREFCRRVPECESPWTDVRPYIEDMGTVMTAADLVLCRAGASTLAELTALGRASVLVPSPNVTNDHQRKNARRLEEVGAAVIREEAIASGRDLFELSRDLVADRLRLVRMERAAASLAVQDSAGKIVRVLAELTRKN